MSDQEIKITVVIPARNESKFLGPTLDALKHQILKPYRIVVVNDGSVDDTSDIAKFFDVDVIDLIDRGYSATGRPVLADVINKGLESISNNECKYIMILGADILLPQNYLSEIVKRMEKEPNLVIASGIIENEFSIEPRGAGRVVRIDFWRKIGFCYPQNYGFEGYLLLKANSLGYKTTSFQDIISTTQRKTGVNYNPKKYYFYGLGYKALGYTNLYVLGKVLLFARKSPKSAFYMLKGYLADYDHLYEKELRDYVCKIQSNGKFKFNLIKRFFKILNQ